MAQNKSLFLSLPFLFLFLRTALSDTRRACYDSDGNQDPDFYACQPDADTSLCCSAGDICYSNSLCRPGPDIKNDGLTTFYYGECTDQSLGSTPCKAESVCLSQNSPGNGITVCGNGYYCCYGLGGCSCTNTTQIFKLADGNIVTTIPVSPSASSTSTKATGTTTRSASSTSGASSGGLSSSTSIGIGVGVGVGGLLLIIAAVAGVWWCLRKRREQRQDEWKHPVAEGHPTQWFQMDEKRTPLNHPPYQDQDQGHPYPKYGGQLDSQDINELPERSMQDY